MTTRDLEHLQRDVEALEPGVNLTRNIEVINIFVALKAALNRAVHRGKNGKKKGGSDA